MTVRDSQPAVRLGGPATAADDLEPAAAPSDEPAAGRAALGRLLAFGRNTWRQLTSMRTALILLFLLALASLPGALLPQWSLNTAKTAQYIIDHPTLGPLLDRFGFFEVFGSPWYAAIYLLLFLSLVGCLLPRTSSSSGSCGCRRWPPRAISAGCRTTTATRCPVRPDQVADRIDGRAEGLADRPADRGATGSRSA